MPQRQVAPALCAPAFCAMLLLIAGSTHGNEAPVRDPCAKLTCIGLAVHLWAAEPQPATHARTQARTQPTGNADRQRALAHARRQLAWANARFAALNVRFVPVSG